MPSFRHEKRCAEAGAIRIAGIDEVGRGPLAGPVVAAVAVIDRTVAKRKLLRLIDDSKKLTLEEREEAYAAMLDSGAVRYAVGEASVEEIDTINIYWAGILAMKRAVEGLSAKPEHLLIDARRLKDLDVPQERIIKGDARSLSIAAASILAKTSRDAMMRDLDATHPGYGFAKHKGYPVKEHLAALKSLGACEAHRRSFNPVRVALGLPPLGEPLVEQSAE